MGLPTQKDDPIKFGSVEELRLKLHNDGCRRCSLGFQPEINGCCVSRGISTAKRMIIGEAPGKEEDSKRSPFTGPAGRLMDQIFSSVGLDTNRDFYCTNIVKCRPYSPKGSGKENFTPKVEQQRLCRPFILEELDLINPNLVVLVGKVAIANMLPDLKDQPMSVLRGQIIRRNSTVWFLMYHPAFILRLRNEEEYAAKLEMWNDIKLLKKIIIDESL